MSKTPGNFYECDRKSCNETAFVPVKISRTDCHALFGRDDRIPDGWKTFDVGALYCPECAKSFNNWSENKAVAE